MQHAQSAKVRRLAQMLRDEISRGGVVPTIADVCDVFEFESPASAQRLFAQGHEQGAFRIISHGRGVPKDIEIDGRILKGAVARRVA